MRPTGRPAATQGGRNIPELILKEMMDQTRYQKRSLEAILDFGRTAAAIASGMPRQSSAPDLTPASTVRTPTPTTGQTSPSMLPAFQQAVQPILQHLASIDRAVSQMMQAGPQASRTPASTPTQLQRTVVMPVIARPEATTSPVQSPAATPSTSQPSGESPALRSLADTVRTWFTAWQASLTRATGTAAGGQSQGMASAALPMALPMRGDEPDAIRGYPGSMSLFGNSQPTRIAPLPSMTQLASGSLPQTRQTQLAPAGAMPSATPPPLPATPPTASLSQFLVPILQDIAKNVAAIAVGTSGGGAAPAGPSPDATADASTGVFSRFVASLRQLNDQLPRSAQGILGVMRSLSLATPAGRQLAGSVSTAVSGVWQGGRQAAGGLSSIARGNFAQGARQVAGGAGSAVGGAAAGIGGAVMAAVGIVGDVVKAFANLPHAIGRFVSALNPSQMLVFDQAMRDLTATVGVALAPVFSMVTSVVRQFGAILLPTMQMLKPAMEQLSASIMDVADVALNAFGNYLQNWVVPAIGLVVKLFDSLTPYMRGVFAALSGFTTMLSRMLNFGDMSSVFANLKTAMGELAKYALLAAANLIRLVSVSASNDFIDGVVAALRGDGVQKKDNTGIAAATNANIGDVSSFGRQVMQAALLATDVGSGKKKETQEDLTRKVIEELQKLKAGQDTELKALGEAIKDAIADGVNDGVNRLLRKPFTAVEEKVQKYTGDFGLGVLRGATGFAGNAIPGGDNG